MTIVAGTNWPGGNWTCQLWLPPHCPFEASIPNVAWDSFWLGYAGFKATRFGWNDCCDKRCWFPGVAPVQPLYAVLPNISCIMLWDLFKFLVEYGVHLEGIFAFIKFSQLLSLGDSIRLPVLVPGVPWMLPDGLKFSDAFHSCQRLFDRPVKKGEGPSAFAVNVVFYGWIVTLDWLSQKLRSLPCCYIPKFRQTYCTLAV